MLKHILLACIMAVSATPAFARDTYNFPIRLYDHEHDHDHADEHDQEGVEAYQTAVDNNFFINGGVLPESQTSFVLLPDGTHYVLDSKFWRAAQQLATLLLEEHEHGSNSNDTWVLAPWQRLSDSVAGRLEPLIEDIQKKHFWVKLSATGVSLFRRYGLPAVVIIGGGETLEHGLCPLPIPLGCAAIYTAGTFSGKHVMRFWNLVRSEFPLEASAGQRMGSGFKQWQWNWQYWRAMKEVYHVSRENRRWLEEPDANSKMAAYFLSQEKSAFLEVQLKLAEQAVASIAKSHPLIFYAVNWHLTTLGQAIDRYSAFLAGRALAGKSVDGEPALIKIDEKFKLFFTSLNDFLKTVDQGSLPLTSVLGQAIWKGPRELKRSIRELQKLGCEQWLEKSQ